MGGDSAPSERCCDHFVDDQETIRTPDTFDGASWGTMRVGFLARGQKAWAKTALMLASAFLLLASTGAENPTAQCVVEGAGDFGTCGGLNEECCKLWLLECDLRCDGAPPQQKLDFECGGLKLKYSCECSGDSCPNSYCAASECPDEAASGGGPVHEEDIDCSLHTCTARPYEVSCPEGQYARFVTSFPSCPIGSPRSQCRHFERCDVLEETTISKEARVHRSGQFSARSSSPRTRGDARGVIFGALVSLLVVLASVVMQ